MTPYNAQYKFFTGHYILTHCRGDTMNLNSNEKCARIIKNLNALDNLMSYINYNYDVLTTLYETREENIDDVEYTNISCALNNFILTSSILKQHIKSFEKDLDESFLKTKKYKKIKTELFENEWYLILLGLRNYLQHIFQLKLGFGNLLSEDGEGEDLFILGFTLIHHEDLHQNKRENVAVQEFFKYCYALPIMPFADENMILMDMFHKQYDKLIHEHYKAEFEKYHENQEVDQYAMDMHDIYLNNLYSFRDKK